MQQLSWTDDMLLRAERPETPMQIQMLLIYDPATAPGGRVTYKGILEEIESRLHLAPTFRRRLTELPGGLHMPYWVDDPDFDLEYHVRHIALPQPGDWRQLCIQIARIHARQIDLRRPPWEMTVIEGLNSVPGVPPGSFAVGLKLHHCVADGMESVELMAAMHDLAPDGPRPDPPETPWEPGELPSTATLVSTDRDQHRPVSLARGQRGDSQRAERGSPIVRSTWQTRRRCRLGAGAGVRLTVRPDHPVQRFRLTPSSFRGPFPRPRRLPAHQGERARGDDQRCRGGIRRRDAAAIPRRATTSCPTTHSWPPAPRRSGTPANKGAGGNRLFGRLQSLETDSADPHERLASIVAESAAFRDNSDSSSSTRLMELVGLVPTTLLGLTVKAATAMPFSVARPIANTTVSNVPGPTEPIYFAGARLVRVTGLGPLIAGMNLFHVIASYNGTVSMGVTADRDALPDPAHYAECMQAAFDELLATTD